MEKYEKALIDLALQSRRLKAMNSKIGEHLDASRKAAESTWEKNWHQWPIEPEEWKELGGKNLWLHRAYKIEREHYDSGVFDEYHAFHDGDVEDYLSENCKHALAAHLLIQERKDIKKALGVAKRRVTFLANRLLDSL